MEIFTYKESPSRLLSPFVSAERVDMSLDSSESDEGLLLSSPEQDFAHWGRHNFEYHSDSIAPEVDSHGAIEYKLHMVSPSPARLAQLTTQLQWRLTQGQGQAIYEIGVADNGNLVGLHGSEIYLSLHTLKLMCQNVDAWYKVVRVIPVNKQHMVVSPTSIPPEKSVRRVIEVHVFKRATEKDVVKVFFIGGQNSGKSSLLGKICYDVLDNGRGKSRLKVLKHRHELISGRTSSIGIDVFGYNCSYRNSYASSASLDDDVFGEHGNLSPSSRRLLISNYTNKYTYEEIVASSGRIIMTFDTPGASNKMGLMCRNMTLYGPDVTVVTISVNSISRWTEYLDLALRSSPRVVILLTKSDILTSTDQVKSLLRAILLRISQFNLNSTDNPYSGNQLFGKMVNSVDVAIECASCDSCVPVFLVSAVSGFGINFLHEYLNALEVSDRDLSAADTSLNERESRISLQDSQFNDDNSLTTNIFGHDHLIDHTSDCSCSDWSRSCQDLENLAIDNDCVGAGMDDEPLNFFVSSIFDSGKILSGVVRSGRLMLGRTYHLALADSDSTCGQFTSVRIIIRSIQKLRVPSIELCTRDIGSVGIEVVGGLNGFKILKGMSILSSLKTVVTETAIFVNSVSHRDSSMLIDTKIGDSVSIYSGFERNCTVIKTEVDGRVWLKFNGMRGEFICNGQRAIIDIYGEKHFGYLVPITDLSDETEVKIDEMKGDNNLEIEQVTGEQEFDDGREANYESDNNNDVGVDVDDDIVIVAPVTDASEGTQNGW
ncbi:hypothetical protein V1511DRAFT_510215 [Dipodascopsis uninucleata]